MTVTHKQIRDFRESKGRRNRKTALADAARNGCKTYDFDLPWTWKDVRLIYFVQTYPGEPIKIGSSRDPIERIRSLQACCPHPLKVLNLTCGSMLEERDIHKKFAHQNTHGEWFEESPELLEFIAAQPTAGTVESGDYYVQPVVKAPTSQERV